VRSVTKAQILTTSGTTPSKANPNIIEVYIGRLRRKIDKPFGRADIETLRGQWLPAADARVNLLDQVAASVRIRVTVVASLFVLLVTAVGFDRDRPS